MISLSIASQVSFQYDNIVLYQQGMTLLLISWSGIDDRDLEKLLDYSVDIPKCGNWSSYYNINNQNL